MLMHVGCSHQPNWTVLSLIFTELKCLLDDLSLAETSTLVIFHLAELSTELSVGWLLTYLNTLLDYVYPNWTVYLMTFNLTAWIVYWMTFNLAELSTEWLLT